MLFSVFLICLFRGRSPLVYLAAFFITTWLEILGTAAGAWKWALVDPVFGLTQGNPPSGVAVWYCLVDAVALSGGPLLSRGLKYVSGWLTSDGYYPEREGQVSGLLGVRGHVREDLQAQIRLTSQAISSSLKNPDLAVEPIDKAELYILETRLRMEYGQRLNSPLSKSWPCCMTSSGFVVPFNRPSIVSLAFFCTCS